MSLGLTACGTSAPIAAAPTIGSPAVTGAVEDHRTPITVSPSITAPVPVTVGPSVLDVLHDPSIRAGFTTLADEFGSISDSLAANDDAAAVTGCTVQAGTAMGLQASISTYDGPVAIQAYNYLNEVIAADIACVGYDWAGTSYHLGLASDIFDSFGALL